MIRDIEPHHVVMAVKMLVAVTVIALLLAGAGLFALGCWLVEWLA